MANNRSKRGAADRRRFAGGEGSEVSDFARKHGITREQAESLIQRVGADREQLNAAAETLTRSA